MVVFTSTVEGRIAGHKTAAGTQKGPALMGSPMITVAIPASPLPDGQDSHLNQSRESRAGLRLRIHETSPALRAVGIPPQARPAEGLMSASGK